MIDENCPRHIGIILDGNRRWAQSRGLKKTEGHKEGAKAVQRIIEHAYNSNLKYLTLYVFSTENWKRSKEEVSVLMKLLKDYLNKLLNYKTDKKIQIRVYGDISALDRSLQVEIEKIVKETENNNEMVLGICLNYGGRAEITEAIKSIAKDVKDNIIDINQIDEKLISSRLYTSSIPDPDLIIRTGNEQRLSNFLTFQSAYSELYFPKDIMWPDFDELQFDKAVEEYRSRNRRYGK